MTILEEPTVTLTIEDNVGWITIQRPKALNALNVDVLQGLISACSKIDQDNDCRLCIVRGAGGKAFVAGADIQMMKDLGPRAIADYVELGQRAMRSVETLRIPVLAAVEGYALGGGLELALACDLVLASSRSKFGQPEVNLGILPGFGGTQRLALRSGLGVARRLILSGELIDSDEALRLGIVDWMVEADGFEDALKAKVSLLLSKGPLALSQIKRLLVRSVEPALLSGLRLEIEAFLDVFGSADREEGMSAFVEKRDPKFFGR